MPQYDFRCKDCQQRFSLSYRAYADYESATPVCSQCGSPKLDRLISQVSIAGLRRDYSKMSSDQMLSVLESGDQIQVSEMINQVSGEKIPDGGPAKNLPLKSKAPQNRESD